ncbi:MAG: hypothetical protein ACPGO3_00315 [Magnetospiraceae bacterium]
MPGLPGIMAQIAEVTSEETARKIMRAWGGTPQKLPVRPTRRCNLSRLVGFENAVKIVTEIGHGTVDIPAGDQRCGGRRRARAVEMLAAGASLAEVANALDMSVPGVRHIRRKMKDDLPLFPDSE